MCACLIVNTVHTSILFTSRNLFILKSYFGYDGTSVVSLPTVMVINILHHTNASALAVIREFGPQITRTSSGRQFDSGKDLSGFRLVCDPTILFLCQENKKE